MDMVMFDLQTAALAAAGSGIPAVPKTDGDGASFSEVLAAQTENTSSTEIPADTAENALPEDGYVIPEEYLPKNVPAAFADIFGQLEKADYGMQKGLKMLLDTVIRAIQGPNDGKQRKTDLFSMFYDNSSSLFGDDEDMFLLCGGFMDQISTVVSLEQEADSDEDDIIAGLAEILKRMSVPKKEKAEETGEDDEDSKNAAVDILAALIPPPPTEEDLDSYVLEDKTGIIENIKEVFSYPKQAVAETAPEKVQKMENLYADYKAAVSEKASDEPVFSHEPIRMSFSGVKINDAAEQIETITGAETAAAMQMPQFIQTAGELPDIPQEEFPETQLNVERQVLDTISERLFELSDDNGTEELVMVLKPEHLGQVAIKLVKENGSLSVTLSAQHAEVGRMMAERAAELSSNLESKDIEVKNIEVVNPGNAAAQMGLDFTNQGFSRRQEYSSEGNRGSYRGIQSIAETDEIEETENIMIREGKLWTQA